MLNIYLPEDISNVLTALDRGNERALAQAKMMGANARDIGLIRAAYHDALDDVATAFGLPVAITLEARTTLKIPETIERR